MATSVFANAGYNGATLSDGLACTTTNTGALQVNAGAGFGGSTATWIAGTKFGGSFFIRCTNAAAQPANLRLPYAASNITASYAIDFTMPTLPTDTNAITVVTQRISTGSVVNLTFQQSGQMNVLAGISGSQASLPAPVPTAGTGTPAAVTAGTNYRAEILVTGSNSTNTGTVAVYLFAYGAATTDYIARTSSSTVVLATAGATATNALVSSDTGMGSYATARTIDLSNVRMVDGAASLQGPYSAATPALDFTITVNPQTVTKGNTLSVTLTRVNGTGVGSNFVAGPVDWGDGTSSPSVSAPGGSSTFTHSTASQTAGDFTGQATCSVS